VLAFFVRADLFVSADAANRAIVIEQNAKIAKTAIKQFDSE
jgi:hypothetical protein